MVLKLQLRREFTGRIKLRPITMVTSNIFGREQWQTYAVVVAPNTKRVTAAALKCTIVGSGVCGLMKEE